MAHERGACTRHDPKIPSVVHTSNSPDSDRGFLVVHRQHAPHVLQAWLKPAQPQTNRTVRTVYTASLSQDATHKTPCSRSRNRKRSVERRTARGVRRRLDTDAAYRTRTPYSNSSRVISDCVPGITLTNARDILEPRTALATPSRQPSVASHEAFEQW
jgi:hypothetical protein